MQEEQVTNIAEGASKGSVASEAKREISSIQFPYGDLDDAVGFAKSVHEVGGQSCLIEQLAGHLKVTPSGGAFRARMAHPRIFGLVEYERGTVKLTSLGMRIVDISQEQVARVEAFLFVPLYKAVYDKYKGYTLPPPAALEREMAGLGVSSKQTDKARQVFDRSAKQAGFFWAGSDRLTLPVTNKGKPETRPVDPPHHAQEQEAQNRWNAKSGGGDGDGHHPFIQGLLQTMPEPGTVWTIEGRAAWLEAAANIFKLIYQGDGKITVSAEPAADGKR
jgi:hypothetical protein